MQSLEPIGSEVTCASPQCLVLGLAHRGAIAWHRTNVVPEWTGAASRCFRRICGIQPGIGCHGEAASLTVRVRMTAGYKLIAIIGATASGKSALAMGLAQQLGAEILSLDSMQVYRGMDIGTAKPTPAEQAGGAASPDRCCPTGRNIQHRKVSRACRWRDRGCEAAGRASDSGGWNAAVLQGAVRGLVRRPVGRRGDSRSTDGGAERKRSTRV